MRKDEFWRKIVQAQRPNKPIMVQPDLKKRYWEDIERHFPFKDIQREV
eukprot:CAMPEP_0201522852 /NCGR_PEP_ID=MMETSP0161_2-20130828/18590_1 /ASSEMBLY_ACC=CAM_ASM_000251 /TAXON_ID=180227 /ORGANISM="Neoparamoeba aestuarina, Strain SoJaBio B1-5/56/2" /LENGTH=47 /DNA_ID= /DNA_START= /DNA_END= /DNA_ORIENTATION=